MGQVESGGNTVTIDCDLRKHIAAAAEPTDSSVGAITQISATADTKLDATQQRGSLSEVVAQDETFYLLVTATTGVATDIILMGAYVNVLRN